MSDPTSNLPDATASMAHDVTETRQMSARRAFLRGAVPLVVTLTAPGVANAVSTACYIRLENNYNTNSNNFPVLQQYLASKSPNSDVITYANNTRTNNAVGNFPSLADAQNKGFNVGQYASLNCFTSTTTGMNGGSSTAFV